MQELEIEEKILFGIKSGKLKEIRVSPVGMTEVLIKGLQPEILIVELRKRTPEGSVS